MSKRHQSDYDEFTTARCERALVTLLGDIGPWSQRVYLVGGLAPRYIVGSLPEGARPHVGTTDVDLVIGLAVGDESPEAYRTLENNLKKAGFRAESSFRWLKTVEGVIVIVEFLCETDQVEPGKIFKPKEGTGTGLGAFNVRGAQLVARDYVEREIEANRLDDGGGSKVVVRVASILSYTVLKILAFQDRHENKDSYDLIYCLLNFGEGPEDAGKTAAQSAIRDEGQVRAALQLLTERFESANNDGPHAYGAFLSDEGDAEETARLRQEAVAVVRVFLAAMG
ncbi:MAG: antitoxin [Acidimicrobiales bacterium]